MGSLADSFDPQKAGVTAPTTTSPAAPPDPNAYDPSKSIIPGAAWLHKAGNEVDDAVTHGFVDPATAKLGDWARALGLKNSTPNVDTLRAQTAQGRQDLGPVAANAIDIATAMTGGGAKIPAAAADAARAATGGSKLAGWGAGAAASGVQSGVDAGLTTLGHGGSTEDAESAAKWHGLIGLGLGATGVGSAKTPMASKSAAEAAADTTAAYTPMKQVAFHPQDVGAAYRDAWNDLTPSQINDLSPVFRSRSGIVGDQLGLIKQRGTASADTIDGFARNLQDAASSKGDGVLASKIGSNLRDVLDKATPVTNHPVGLAGRLQDAASAAASRTKNAQMIEEAQRVGGLPGGGGIGQTLPDAAQSALKNSPQFYQGDNEAAMKSLAGAGQSIPSSWLLKHAVGYPIAGALAGGIGGGAHGYATGGSDPWAHAGQEALEYGGAGLGVGIGTTLGKKYLVNKALSTAGPTLTAGAPYSPPQAPIGQLLRSVWNSRGASAN